MTLDALCWLKSLGFNKSKALDAWFLDIASEVWVSETEVKNAWDRKSLIRIRVEQLREEFLSKIDGLLERLGNLD